MTYKLPNYQPNFKFILFMLLSAISFSLFAQTTTGSELVTSGTFDNTNFFGVDDWTTTGTNNTAGTQNAASVEGGELYFNRGGSPFDGTASQDIATVVGERYSVSFEYRRAGGQNNNLRFRFTLYDTTTGIGSPFVTEEIIPQSSDFVNYTYAFEAIGTSTTIYFNDETLGSGGSRDIAIDNVSAMKLVTPGGVASNIKLWMKANAGTSTTTNGVAVATWTDQSGNGYLAQQQDAIDNAIYIANEANFNPILRFDQSTSRAFELDNPLFTQADLPAIGIEAFYVIIDGADTGSGGRILFNGTGNNNRFYLQNNGGRFGSLPNPAAISYPAQYLVSTQYDNLDGNGTGASARTMNAGNEDTRTGNDWDTIVGSEPWAIGHQSAGDNTTRRHDGDIAELIIYDALNPSERLQIQSYLALKYGITLDQTTATDYLASDASIIWEATIAGTHNNDILGIGRDDNSGLNQEISKSVNDDAIITLTTGGNFTDANDGSRTDLSDMQFLTLANNDAALELQSTELNVAGLDMRIAREWNVQNINNVGAVNIKFEGFGGYTILTDADSDFSNGASTLVTLDANGEATGVILNNGFITLAKAADYTSLYEAYEASQQGGFVAGIYAFLINGEVFSSFVGPNGNVLIASADLTEVNDTSGYTQVSQMTLQSDDILAPSILAALNPSELQFTSSSGTVINRTTTSTVMIDRLKNNETLSQSANDHNFWTGTGGSMAYTGTPFQSTLDQIIWHSTGNGSNLHWFPGTGGGGQKDGFASSANDTEMNLWARDTTAPLAPGGISTNLALWLKADAGTNSMTEGDDINTWNDQSSNGYIANQGVNTANRPTFNEDGLNFNPSINFEAGSNATGFNLGSDYIFAPNANNGMHIFTVAEPTQAAGAKFVYDFGSTNNRNIGLVVRTGDVIAVAGGGSTTLNTTLTGTRLVDFDLDFGDVALSEPAMETVSVNGEILSTTTTGVWTKVTTAEINQAGTHGIAQGPVSIGRQSKSDNLNNDGGRRFFGDMGEVIVYNGEPSEIETRQIQSYLALKYGITLNNGTTDYLASDGTSKMWDATVAATYNNDIAGIGRDDDSALNQKQSKSVNANGIVVMGLSTIETSNIANTAAFANDKNFMVWANNNGAATWSATGAPTNFQILDKQWQIQETGTVSAVTIQFDVADTEFDVPAPIEGTSYYLIYDSNNDDDLSNETPIALTNSSGDIWETSTAIDFANGMEFSLATQVAPQNSPGGVASNLALWLKADAGVSTTGGQVSQWDDQASNNLITSQATISPSADVILNQNTLNFNAAVEFTGANNKSLKAALSNNSLFDGAISIYTVVVPDDVSGSIEGIIDSSTKGLLVNGGNYTTDASGNVGAETPAVADIPTLVGAVYTQNSLANSRSYINGEFKVLETAGTASAPANYFEVGGRTQNGSSHTQRVFNGEIAEVVVFKADQATGSAERQQIQSYLALKYGITLDQTTATDYLASDGTTKMWDATQNAGFGYDIFGIGRDDASALGQVQSQSVNADGIITLLADGEGTNAANTFTDIDDLEFLTISNDNDPAATGCPTTPNQGDGNEILIEGEFQNGVDFQPIIGWDPIPGVNQSVQYLSAAYGTYAQGHGAQQTITGLTPGDNYVLDVDQGTIGGANGTRTWDITIIDPNGNNILTLTTPDASVGGNRFQEYCFTATTAQVTVRFRSSGTNTTGTAAIYMRDLSLQKFTMANAGPFNPGGIEIQTNELDTATYFNRLDREWKVDETGEVGTIELSAKLAGLFTADQEVYLLIDDDSNFDADLVSEIEATSWDGTTAVFSGLDLNDADYFTFAATAKPAVPGGISADLALWLKGDNGITETSGIISSWTDQTGINTFNTITGDPQIGASMINFNNAVDFDGDDYIDGSTPNVKAEAYVVGTYNNAGDSGIMLGQASGPNNEYFFFKNTPTSLYIYTNTPSASAHFSSTPPAAGVPSILGGNLNGANKFIRINSLDQNLTTQGSSTPGPITNIPRIGGRANATAVSPLDGSIAEVISYSSSTSAIDRQKIESYLALKYGITLGQENTGGLETTIVDYLASDGSFMWSKAKSQEQIDFGGGFIIDNYYMHNVFGIGRDDASDLNQRVSKSVNTDALLEVALESNFNDANNAPSRIVNHANDLQFLSFGHDNPSTETQSTTIAGTNLSIKLAREWRVQRENFTQNATLRFPDRAGWSLIVRTTGEQFTSSSVIGELNANGEIEVTNAQLPDQAIFTVATMAPFVTTWTVDASDLEIFIPTRPGSGTYDYTVNWGDGTIETGITTEDFAHTYAAAGTYTVEITGDFPHFYSDAGNSGSAQVDIDNMAHLSSIEQWGGIEWSSLSVAFARAINMSYNATDAPNLANVTSLDGTFGQVGNMNDANLSNWNVSTITDMRGTFSNTGGNLTGLDNWDVSNVTRMQGTFLNANVGGDIGGWDTSSVTNFVQTFRNNSTFNHDISNWNLSSATTINGMFLNAPAFNQDISTWERVSGVDGATSTSTLANVTNFQAAFQSATVFDAPIGNWNTSSAQNMAFMFLNASNFNQDVSAWNTAGVVNMERMFDNAAAFDQDLSGFDMTGLQLAIDSFLVTSQGAVGMLNNSGLSLTNYDATLIGWASQTLDPVGELGAAGLEYCNGSTAHASIITDGWTINGDIENCDTITLAEVLEDSNSTGGADNANGTAVTATQLAAITGIVNVIPANEAEYQAAINSETGFSNPPTVAEVQAIIDAVNAAVTASNNVLTQIGNEGDDPDTVNSVVTVAQLQTIIPEVTGLVAGNETEYQDYIDENPNLFSSPATQAEVQAMVDAVNTTVTNSNNVLTQIGNEGDDPDSVNSVVTVAQLQTIIPEVTGLVASNETEYQDYIDENPELFSSPATQAEVQAMVDAVNATLNTSNSVLAQIGNEGDNPNTIASIVTAAQLGSIVGIMDVTLANEEKYQEYIDSYPDEFSNPATVAEVQAMIDTVNESEAVLAQIGSQGDNPDTVPSVVTIVQLESIIGIMNIDSANQEAYQAYIDTYPELFSNPATTAEVQAMIDAVNLSENVLAQIGNEADNPDTVPSVITSEQLNAITGIMGVNPANITAYQEYIDANPELFSNPPTLEEIQNMIEEVNDSGSVLTQIGNEGDDPNNVVSVVTINQLNNITGITGVDPLHEMLYQEYIDNNPNAFSAPATVEEVQAMITEVNEIAQIVGNSNDPADGNPSESELEAAGITDINPDYIDAYEEAIANADPAPNSLEELQIIIDAVNAVEQGIEGALAEILEDSNSTNGNDNANGSAVTVEQLEEIPGLVNIIAANEEAYQIAINNETGFSNPPTIEEIQAIIDAVNALMELIENADSPADGNPSISELDEIGITELDPLREALYEEAIANANPQPQSLEELQAIIDMVNNTPINVIPAQAFTPNGDGINDSWIIQGIEDYPNNVVRVYNRYGREVFAAKGYQNNWQANFNDNSKKLPPASYYYTIDLGDGSALKNGWIFINY